MIGLKSACAIAVSAVLVAAGALRGVLAPAHLAQLGATACFVVALIASLALGLVAVGWRPELPSRTALGRAGLRLTIVEDAAPRELPAIVQRALLLAGFASVALVAISNHAAARLLGLPGELAEPSRSEYCLPEPAAPAAAPAPAPVEVAQPGCALVRRAFQLGYAKSLGSCAPARAAAPVVAAAAPEVCTRRELDEPLLHYGYRRIAGALGSSTVQGPIAALDHRIDDIRAHLDYLDGLIADIRHAIEGSPHAAHHLWVDLPDPHPGSWLELFTGAPRCGSRFANLPLWPAWRAGDRAALVEHVLGQLLFAARFGTTASCNDYTIHWDAPHDACARLAADPAGFLDAHHALGSVRAVLDRRRRQLELIALARALGRTPPAPPPEVSAVVSLACLEVGGAAAGPSGRTVTIDGDPVSLRELHVADVRPTGDGPIDVYRALAALLGGADPALAPPNALAPADLAGDDFPLARLDQLVDADPFRGARWPLDHPELIAVFPFERHLHAFVDAFRRRYLAQRGRL